MPKAILFPVEVGDSELALGREVLRDTPGCDVATDEQCETFVRSWAIYQALLNATRSWGEYALALLENMQRAAR